MQDLTPVVAMQDLTPVLPTHVAMQDLTHGGPRQLARPERQALEPAAFYKDPWGVVHLKGLVKATKLGPGVVGPCTLFLDRLIFTLPAGYRPAKRSVFMVITNEQAADV